MPADPKWAKLLRARCCALHSLDRIKFLNRKGKNNDRGQTIWYYGPHEGRFDRAYAHLAAAVRARRCRHELRYPLLPALLRDAAGAAAGDRRRPHHRLRRRRLVRVVMAPALHGEQLRAVWLPRHLAERLYPMERARWIVPERPAVEYATIAHLILH